MKFVLDPFCFRHFDPKYEGGTKILLEKEKFIAEVNKIFSSGKVPLVDGYAPFCKHLFVPNFANCSQDYVKISIENKKAIETEYKARRKEELGVLCRFIRKENLSSIPLGKWLDVILYSREQILKENEAMNQKFDTSEEYDYGVVSIKCIGRNEEVPMQPITMMRNALGKEHGGSGVELDRLKYEKSVEFWNEHVSII